MRFTHCALIASAFFAAAPLAALAAEMTAEEKAFVEKHAAEIVRVEPTKVDDANVAKVFATPFYRLKVIIKDGDGEQTQELMVHRSGDALVGNSSGHTDGELPDLVKMFHPDFKLKTDDDAKALSAAIEAVYPTASDEDKKLQKFSHAGNEWTFVRGKFFDKTMGYVLTTDAGGKIVGAKYVMKLPG